MAGDTGVEAAECPGLSGLAQGVVVWVISTNRKAYE
jgi:hypothetical protein